MNPKDPNQSLVPVIGTQAVSPDEISEASEFWVPEPKQDLDFSFHVMDPEGWWRADVRADGCVHLYQFFNTPYEPGQVRNPDNDAEMEDYLHICNLQETIERLQDLQRITKSYFRARE